MKSNIVLVTGASRGIGKAIALKFAEEGYHVIITCLSREDELLQTKKEIETFHVTCMAFVGDMGNYSVVFELFSAIKKQYGRIDVLINNAGISYIGLFTDTDITIWNNVIASNLTSVYNCCSLAVPDMIAKQKGKIINISSVWGNVGASCEVAYSASKGGMNAFTKALAKELGPSNIQVNAVACGIFNTQMNQFLKEGELDSLTDEIPAGRLGLVEEAASFVFQLAISNDYLNGQVIQLDGAWL